MKRLSVTSIQRSMGELSIALIRGEDVIITRNGKDIAKLVAIEPKFPKNKEPALRGIKPKIVITDEFKAPQIKAVIPTGQQVIDPNYDLEKQTSLVKCEAPYVNCHFPGELYSVEFSDAEGIKKKLVHLCPGHAKKARETSEGIEKI